MGFLKSFAEKYSSSGRRLKKKERSFQKAQQKYQIANIDEELGFRAKEDPREQSMLRQSMFGRGLGKSTIHAQGMERLKGMQARRIAALKRNRDLAQRGLSLIKLRAKTARRLAPYDWADDALQGFELAGGAGLLGGKPPTSEGLGDHNFL